MISNILITGLPRSGKSTLLAHLISSIPNKVGFITHEIRENDQRVGFQLENSLGHSATLAHIEFENGPKVARYTVNIENLDSILSEITTFGETDLLYIDEIGQMELFSERFKRLVTAYLDSSNITVATISAVYQDDFIESVRNRKDVILIEITEENRDEKERFATQLIGKIKKAQGYAAQSERFSRVEGGMVLKSEHGTRELKVKDGQWSCDCEFYDMYGICSHVIAVEEINRRSK